jgi:hypothetical protein
MFDRLMQREISLPDEDFWTPGPLSSNLGGDLAASRLRKNTTKETKGMPVEREDWKRCIMLQVPGDYWFANWTAEIICEYAW